MVMLMCENETCITKFDTNNMHARYPCCSIECFREWENDLNHKVVRHFSTPSLKDFIGKECNVLGLEKDSFELSNGDRTAENINGSIITHKYNYSYLGSDDAHHIIQRKEDGEPDGIFFFPKAAVALRF